MPNDHISMLSFVCCLSVTGVLTSAECNARQTVMFTHYVNQVEIEAMCMIDMINQHVVPALKIANVGPVAELHAAVSTLQSAVS